MSMTQANMAAAAVGSLALAVTDATRTKWLLSVPVCHTLSPGSVGLAAIDAALVCLGAFGLYGFRAVGAAAECDTL